MAAQIRRGVDIGDELIVGRDGVEVEAADAGEHLGLAILQERARRLGGELSVESEPAEGTRVELNFSNARAR